MMQNRYPEAQHSYIRATKRNPRFGDAYNNLGNCQLALHKHAAAAASYRAAVRAAPREANYYCNLGSLVARFVTSGWWLAGFGAPPFRGESRLQTFKTRARTPSRARALSPPLRSTHAPARTHARTRARIHTHTHHSTNTQGCHSLVVMT